MLEITVGVIRRVRPADDGQLVGEGQPVFRIDVRKSPRDRRVHGQPEQVGTSQVRFRQSEKQLHRLANPPLAGRWEVDQRVRQIGGVVEHRPSERQVPRGGRGRNDDREVAEPERPAGLSAPFALFVAPEHRPDLGGDRLELPTGVRRGDDRQRVVGARTLSSARLSVEHLALQGGQQGGAPSLAGIDEARVEIEIDQLVEKPNVVAAGFPPTRQQRVVPARRQGRRRTVERQRQLPGRRCRPLAARRLLAAGPPPTGHVDVFPELTTGVERVDVKARDPAQRREDRSVQPGHVRDAEDVQGRNAQGVDRDLGEEIGQGQRARRRQRGAATKQRQPGLPLPALQILV